MRRFIYLGIMVTVENLTHNREIGYMEYCIKNTSWEYDGFMGEEVQDF
jgi:hypothetical protein